jgi:hypothetical protein
MQVAGPVTLIASVTLTMGLALVVIGGAQQKNAAAAPESCATTKAPVEPFVPPSPYPTKTDRDDFWFGTNKLWTQLRKDGTWQGLPQWADGTFRQKIFWFSEGYSWHRAPQPRLEITGQHLDVPASAPLKLLDVASNGWTNAAEHPFIVSATNLPTLGCWKITGHYEDGELSFVVWVTE